jgi:hypothetical protein
MCAGRSAVANWKDERVDQAAAGRIIEATPGVTAEAPHSCDTAQGFNTRQKVQFLHQMGTAVLARRFYPMSPWRTSVFAPCFSSAFGKAIAATTERR